MGDGDLCGATHLIAFTILDQSAAPTSGMFVFATNLTTDGRADGTVPSGDMTWFFTLAHQPGGPWRISGGGSGP